MSRAGPLPGRHALRGLRCHLGRLRAASARALRLAGLRSGWLGHGSASFASDRKEPWAGRLGCRLGGHQGVIRPSAAHGNSLLQSVASRWLISPIWCIFMTQATTGATMETPCFVGVCVFERHGDTVKEGFKIHRPYGLEGSSPSPGTETISRTCAHSALARLSDRIRGFLDQKAAFGIAGQERTGGQSHGATGARSASRCRRGLFSASRPCTVDASCARRQQYGHVLHHHAAQIP